MNVFIAGHIIEQNESGIIWDIVGAFSTAKEAEHACYDDHCFIGPLVLNEPLPKEIINWPGSYFPKTTKDLVAKKETGRKISKSVAKRILAQQDLPTRMRRIAYDLWIYRYGIDKILQRPIDYTGVEFMAHTLEGWANELDPAPK